MKLVLAAILLASPTMLYAAPPDIASVTGLWKITGDVHGRPVDMTCRLAENDRKLTGSCTRSGDDSEPHQIDGTIKGDKLQFQLQTAVGSRPVTLIVNGKLTADDSRVAGNLDVEPLGVGGKFEGERESDVNTATVGQSPSEPPSSNPAEPPAPPPPAAPAPSPQTATGTWKVDADFQGTTAQLTCTLKQDDTILTGTCTGEDGKANPLKGEVTEHGLTWHFDTEYQGQPITVTMNAKLNADGTMQGDASVAPMDAQGTFTAARQPPAAPTTPTAPASTAGTPPAQ